MMKDMKIDEFIKLLSSDAAVPGGGGAAGLVAGIGMSLGNMVCALTTGKKKYAEYQEEIEESIVKANDITERLLACMDKDAESFEPLSKAYGLPKNTDEEIAKRNEIMEKALVTATEAPLNMMSVIYEALELLSRLAVIGSRMAISDVGVGLQMCKAAMHGASLNVYINTKLMKNRDYAEGYNAKADKLIADADKIADEAYKLVIDAIR